MTNETLTALRAKVEQLPGFERDIETGVLQVATGLSYYVSRADVLALLSSPPPSRLVGMVKSGALDTYCLWLMPCGQHAIQALHLKDFPSSVACKCGQTHHWGDQSMGDAIEVGFMPKGESSPPPEDEPPVYGSDVLCAHCATVFCPHGERLHFDKDGCPQCSMDEPPKAEPTLGQRSNAMRDEILHVIASHFPEGLPTVNGKRPAQPSPEAEPPTWLPISTYNTEQECPAPIVLRPHRIHGAMDVRRRSDAEMAATAPISLSRSAGSEWRWINGDSTTAWTEDAFLPFWMPRPAQPTEASR